MIFDCTKRRNGASICQKCEETRSVISFQNVTVFLKVYFKFNTWNPSYASIFWNKFYFRFETWNPSWVSIYMFYPTLVVYRRGHHKNVRNNRRAREAA
jgi:hypothetical protein